MGSRAIELIGAACRGIVGAVAFVAGKIADIVKALLTKAEPSPAERRKTLEGNMIELSSRIGESRSVLKPHERTLRRIADKNLNSTAGRASAAIAQRLGAIRGKMGRVESQLARGAGMLAARRA